MDLTLKIMTIIKRYKTNMLFPRPSILIGVGSVFNISGNYFSFNYSKSNEAADLKALENDFGVVGNDIKRAAHQRTSKLIHIR